MEAGKVLRLCRGDSIGLRTQTRSLIARGGRRGAGGKTRTGREAVSGASSGAALETGHTWVEVPVPDLVLQRLMLGKDAIVGMMLGQGEFTEDATGNLDSLYLH